MAHPWHRRGESARGRVLSGPWQGRIGNAAQGEHDAAPEGGPLRLHLFRRRIWYPAVRESVGEPMRPHDLRHTHVALFIAEGEDPYVISQRLGHASIRATYDVYGHLLEGRDREAADALEKARSRSLARSPQASSERAVVSIELSRGHHLSSWPARLP